MGFPGGQWLGLSTFIAVAQVQSLVGELNPPSHVAVLTPPSAPTPCLQKKNWLKATQYALGLGLTPEPVLVTKTVFCESNHDGSGDQQDREDNYIFIIESVL